MASPSPALPSVATAPVEEDLLSPATLAMSMAVMSLTMEQSSTMATKLVSLLHGFHLRLGSDDFTSSDSGGDGGKAISGSATGGNAW